MNSTLNNMFDIAIVGAGSGGYELAIEANKNGLKVVLIEKKAIGGVCLNSGCIPTKAYYQYAKTMRSTKRLFNTDLKADLSKFKEEKNNIIDLLSKGIISQMEGVKIIYGEAHFNINKELVVNDMVIKASSIVLAIGSKDRILDIEGKELAITPKELLDLDKLPATLTIIGGGVIGVEMACIFNAFTSKVTIFEYLPNIIPAMDKDVSKRLQNLMKTSGIDIYTSYNVKKITNEDGLKVVHAISDNKEIDVTSEYVLMAVGREVDPQGLGLEYLGIDYSNKGIKVDSDTKETNYPNIYAIGDCNGEIMLAHKASFDAKRVLNHILKKADNINFKYIPVCSFTFPEVAMIGMSEEECQKKGIDVQVIKEMYRSNGKAQAIKEVDGFVKLLVYDDKILGASIIGSDANLLINEVMVIMNANIKLCEVKDYIHAHPTLSEIIQSALNDVK